MASRCRGVFATNSGAQLGVGSAALRPEPNAPSYYERSRTQPRRPRHLFGVPMDHHVLILSGVREPCDCAMSTRTVGYRTVRVARGRPHPYPNRTGGRVCDLRHPQARSTSRCRSASSSLSWLAQRRELMPRNRDLLQPWAQRPATALLAVRQSKRGKWRHRVRRDGGAGDRPTPSPPPGRAPICCAVRRWAAGRIVWRGLSGLAAVDGPWRAGLTLGGSAAQEVW